MKSFGITDIGLVRQYNQDYSLECDEPIGNLENLYVVCDGLGGRNAGEYASQIAAENFFDLSEFSDAKLPLSIFKEAITKVNSLVLNESKKPEYQGMATTLVACTVSDDTAYFVNVGDSRAYIFGDEVTQVTWDHSYVSELVRRGQITKDEARTHAKNNIITRAVGAEETVEPDYFQAYLEDDEIILLCSDGLYNMVGEDDLHEVICGRGSLKEKARRLVEMAKEAGGKDNIAVVLISK
ncbi:MAG: Stp1/IreP family PP2C-type Ser/Thr phosphatase [Lachnospiraceae bacterium]|nr:Stp1/IreP family PP2C-type Ser/Thr phosphatase [Lachnospiraceae bacterium]MBR3004462.1 Stp1/IreP family PP2C-type Ser/Thr phosphatase [Lachnospiraceae bacterium]MBR6349745.1 Stp1/IreP family PP2C-type Ser/Thr phosphatase [Lachnospiraceae bacterium]